MIIPALCENARLAKLIPYLAEHASGKSVEVIVVDASPGTKDPEWVKDYPNVRWYTSAIQSRAVQMNQGFQHSSGETVAFLHADVWPPEDFIEQIEKCVAGGADAGWFCYRFEPSSFWLIINERTTRTMGIFSGGGDQFIFVKRHTFTTMKGFNEKMEIMEDFEFTRRLKQSEFSIGLVQSPCTVSSRKYERNSWVKVNVINGITFGMFLLKISPKTIKKFYKWALRPPLE